MNMKMKLFYKINQFLFGILVLLVVFFVGSPQKALADTSGSLSISNYEKNVDEVFTIPISYQMSDRDAYIKTCNRDNSTGKHQVSTGLSFSPDKLTVLSVSNGLYSVHNWQTVIDNVTGKIKVTAQSYEDCDFPISGTLINLTLRVKQQGSSNISFISSETSYTYVDPSIGQEVTIPLSLSNGKISTPVAVVTPTTTPNTTTASPSQQTKTAITGNNSQTPTAIQNAPQVATSTENPQDNNIKSVEGDSTTKKSYNYLYIILIAVLFTGGLLIGINYQKIKNKFFKKRDSI